ncbi:hypothetical protein B7494_g7675 [Chlorociboria aeruginascens]|nr:hypothetical protein B7494_g7675 [Chlorociboria aeruginascens]
MANHTGVDQLSQGLDQLGLPVVSNWEERQPFDDTRATIKRMKAWVSVTVREWDATKDDDYVARYRKFAAAKKEHDEKQKKAEEKAQMEVEMARRQTEEHQRLEYEFFQIFTAGIRSGIVQRSGLSIAQYYRLRKRQFLAEQDLAQLAKRHQQISNQFLAIQPKEPSQNALRKRDTETSKLNYKSSAIIPTTEARHHINGKITYNENSMQRSS